VTTHDPAGIDPLTGLYTRAAVWAAVESRRVAATKTAGSLAVVDLDDLKLLNDRLGHVSGDLVIAEYARRLGAVPGTSLVARIGGDEFAVVFDDTDPGDVGDLLGVASCAQAGPVQTAAGPVNATFSAGVTELRYGEGPGDALVRADRALFQAKRDGRDRVRVYDASTVQFVADRRDLFARLEVARTRAEQFEAEARTDVLTGLANPRALDETAVRFDRVRARTARGDAVLFVDLDKFHSFNHTHGQAAGNEALIEVARALSRACRAEDLCFRYGGEELVVLLADTTLEAAAEVGERVRAAVGDLGIAHGGLPGVDWLTVTVVAGAVGRERSTIAAIDEASRVAYRSKEAGARNVVVVTHE
jgi:diguanylate cyclase (GGDEF)-like protein